MMCVCGKPLPLSLLLVYLKYALPRMLVPCICLEVYMPCNLWILAFNIFWGFILGNCSDVKLGWWETNGGERARSSAINGDFS